LMTVGRLFQALAAFNCDPTAPTPKERRSTKTWRSRFPSSTHNPSMTNKRGSEKTAKQKTPKKKKTFYLIIKRDLVYTEQLQRQPNDTRCHTASARRDDRPLPPPHTLRVLLPSHDVDENTPDGRRGEKGGVRAPAAVWRGVGLEETLKGEGEGVGDVSG
jgi:hypothetical protein